MLASFEARSSGFNKGIFSLFRDERKMFAFIGLQHKYPEKLIQMRYLLLCFYLGSIICF